MNEILMHITGINLENIIYVYCYHQQLLLIVLFHLYKVLKYTKMESRLSVGKGCGQAIVIDC